MDRLRRQSLHRSCCLDGLTPAETRVLWLVDLLAAEGPDPSPSAIAKAAHLAPSALSQVLRSLEHKGLIARMRCQRDGRGVRVRLTDQGASSVGSIRARQDSYWSDLLAYLGPDDAEALARIMGRVVGFQERYRR
ncbi:MarR family transcriptional regulator [Eggerthellaceae bacterium zg-997]|nr:MarR family transcriptional regulator [Eggerthellaceae bacterium zg-997]